MHVCNIWTSAPACHEWNPSLEWSLCRARALFRLSVWHLSRNIPNVRVFSSINGYACLIFSRLIRGWRCLAGSLLLLAGDDQNRYSRVCTILKILQTVDSWFFQVFRTFNDDSRYWQFTIHLQKLILNLEYIHLIMNRAYPTSDLPTLLPTPSWYRIET